MRAGASSCDFEDVVAGVEALLARYPAIPGAGLQLGYADEVVFERYWGSYDADTVVPIASATKLLSATALMTVVDDGLIDLDAPVDRYLPQFTGAKGAMTVLQMFSHTAGMPSNAQLLNSRVLNARNGLTLAGAVDLLACCEPLRYAPGAGFAYGGASMHIAGRVAEVVTGEDWFDLFLERLGEPLGLQTTDYDGLGVTRNYRIAGGAQANLRDYGRVARMLLAEGRLDDTRVLSQAAVRTMREDNVGDLPILYAPPQVPQPVRYGIGGWLAEDTGMVGGLTSPGAFGFTPWVDDDLGFYGVLLVEDSNSRVAPFAASVRAAARSVFADTWCGQQAPSVTREPGLWFDRSRPGHGVDIQRFGDRYAGVFYTFDSAGAPEWFWLDVTQTGERLEGSLLRFENQGNQQAIAAEASVAGTAALDFGANSRCGSGSASFDWSLGADAGAWCLQPLLTTESRPRTNANGLWWNGAADSGWGMSVYADTEQELRIVYFYDEDGTPIWAFGQEEVAASRFDMLAPAGYCRTCPIAEVLGRPVGRFDGALAGPILDEDDAGIEAALVLEHWERASLSPRVLSNPAW
ncbi:MAG: serine hydrolase domain-containing protein [Pseudomonadota bacterium]